MRGSGSRKIPWLFAVLLLTAIMAPARAEPTGAETGAGLPKINQQAHNASTANDPLLLPRRSPAAQGPSRSGPSAPGVSPLNLLWPMLIVVGAIVTLAMMLKRWGLVRRTPTGRGGLQILSRQFLSNKQSLCVVRFGRRVVCLGVTPERISTLVQVDDPEEASQMVGAIERAAPASFTSRLSNLTRHAAQREPEIEPPAAVTRLEPSTAGREVRLLLGRVRAMADAQATAEPA